MTTYDVFLSYNGADRVAVVALAEKLAKAGLRPFLDRWHLVAGQQFIPALEEALEASGTIAVFFGPKGVSRWQEAEKQLALDLVTRARQQGRRVIPVILPGGHQEDVEGFIRLRTWVDLADEDGFARLLAGIQGRALGGPAPSVRGVEGEDPLWGTLQQGPSSPRANPAGSVSAPRPGPLPSPTVDNRGAAVQQQIIVQGNATFGPMNVGPPRQEPASPGTERAADHEPRHRKPAVRQEPGAIAARLANAYSRRDELTSSGQDTSDVVDEIRELRRAQRQGPTLRAGEFLGDGRFQLVKVIGQGGFATVWKANDRIAAGLVAVKVLHGQFADVADRRARLFRGAERMQQLQHPHVVRVLVPKGEEQGFYFYVMEYVAGGNLQQAVLEGRIDRDQALAIVEAIASALEAAHAQGLVHRDVKPQNILLHDDGRAALSDFDLVHARDTTGGTRTGALGTVLYAAPEQNEDAREVDHRADVYSLGMTAMFCIHGDKLPQAAMFDRERFLRGLSCSNEVRKVLRKAVAPRPDDRFQSMASLRAALSRARLADLTHAVVGPRMSRRSLVVGGVAVGAAGVGLAYCPPSGGGGEPSLDNARPPKSDEGETPNRRETDDGTSDGKTIARAGPEQKEDPTPAPEVTAEQEDESEKRSRREADGGTSDPKTTEGVEPLQEGEDPSRERSKPTPAPEVVAKQEDKNTASAGVAGEVKTPSVVALETKLVEGVEMVRIPAGRFTMGSPRGEEGRFDRCAPQHDVELASFWLARAPVTNAQYGEYLRAKPKVAKPKYWTNPKYNRPEQPVVGVTWEEAKAYCEWAELLLPTEAQWEYACRAGTTTRYWSGDAERDVARVGWYDGNSGGVLHPVSEKPANPFGLFDMHGNVWEWCEDTWVHGYDGAVHQPGNGLRVEPVGGAIRVFRGGCFGSGARGTESVCRGHDGPGFRGFYVGFRPAQGHP